MTLWVTKAFRLITRGRTPKIRTGPFHGHNGVWELKPGSDGARYRYGNNPVRGVELARDYGSATLIALYTTRLAAKSHADELN